MELTKPLLISFSEEVVHHQPIIHRILFPDQCCWPLQCRCGSTSRSRSRSQRCPACIGGPCGCRSGARPLIFPPLAAGISFLFDKEVGIFKSRPTAGNEGGTTGGFVPGRSPMVQSCAVVLPHPLRSIPQVLSPLTKGWLAMMYIRGGFKEKCKLINNTLASQKRVPISYAKMQEIIIYAP